MANLRDTFRDMTPDEKREASRLAELEEWRLNNRFCGRCGAAMKPHDNPAERAFVCPSCGYTSYPKIAPAVITLVTKGDRVLLQRNTHYKGVVWSLVAGFVDAGESLEDAVRREIREEASIEKGSIILIGATTENPSFEVNGALLSRCKVFVLKGLTEDEIVGLLRRALTDPRGFGRKRVVISDDMLKAIAVFANGDARAALSTLEMVVLNSDETEGRIAVTADCVEQCTSRKSLLYDKGGEEHYNIISALHKSMRNSDPDAAVYWLARMLEGGEDPLYVARRVTRFASEDVGLADPRALEIAVAAYHACHFIGMPECSVHLAEAVSYLSIAPKSNSAYIAYERAKADALERIAEPVPLVIRNAPTKLMKELEYGKGYKLAHYAENKIADLQCLPDSLQGTEYYSPTSEGVEARIAKRLEEIKAWKAELVRRRNAN